MFERYTERARRVLFFARYEASQLGSLSIEPEHLLLGLLREGKGLTSRLFARAHLSLESLRREINREVVFSEKIPTSQEIPFSAAAKRVLEAAATESDELLHNYIGTEHLLLGLLSEETTLAGRLLAQHGLRLQEVREQIIQLLDQKETVLETADANVAPAVRRFDERTNTRLSLSRLLRVSMYRIDTPDRLDTPLSITREPKTADVYVMTVNQEDRLTKAAAPETSAEARLSMNVSLAGTPSQQPPRSLSRGPERLFGPLSLPTTTMADLAYSLEHILEMPVIDETGLAGHYRIDLSGPHDTIEAFVAAIEQAGLKLTRARREIEMVIVRPA